MTGFSVEQSPVQLLIHCEMEEAPTFEVELGVALQAQVLTSIEMKISEVRKIHISDAVLQTVI